MGYKVRIVVNEESDRSAPDDIYLVTSKERADGTSIFEDGVHGGGGDP